MSDVAKLAGVSMMTVSRVLNDRENVREDTRTLVLAAIEKLRYQPNELARSLREQRTRQIGVVVPYLFDPFFAMCAHGIGSIARQHAYSVVLSTSGEDPGTEFLEVSRMLRRNVEGVVVIPAACPGEPSRLLNQAFERLPIVSLDRPIEGSRFDSVLVENERGAQLGTEHLIRLGHRRIAFVGLLQDSHTMRMREAGYCATMSAARLRSRIVHISEQMDDALEAMRSLLSPRHPPTAVFCANNLVSRHVLHGLQAMNLFPPKPVALVGFDDFETADLLRPGITAVRQPVEELARIAAETLFERLDQTRPARPPQRVVLPVELIIRGSCGATKAGSSKPSRATATAGRNGVRVTS